MTNKIQFREDFGRIKFIYREPCKDGGYYEIRKTISSEIIQKGKEGILKYALSKINEARKEWKKGGDIRNGIKKNHILLQTQYRDGTSLEGRIVEATHRVIKVELDKPLKGRSEINFGFASAMARCYVFTEDHEISPEGYSGARKALCWAYRDALHKPEKDLVRCLNQKLKVLI